MTDSHDKRLIEHYIPIKAISAEASREKSIRHGHISTLHLWWARRPLVASRAAVFAALVPADAQPQITETDIKTGEQKPMSMTRFMVELCKWELSDSIIEEARRLIREAYPDGPPKVLDMFAGGGSIPLEALRLGCEAYALDLNPVAHIIELATLVYPQKYGKKLAEDVKKWGEWVLERVRAEVGDLYPLIPDPELTNRQIVEHQDQAQQLSYLGDDSVRTTHASPLHGDDMDDDWDDAPDGTTANVPPGWLQPVAYLWTRTVTCPNPSCRATVPLVRQTWLKKKKGDNVALEMLPHPTENRMAFYVRKARSPQDFGFDPTGFSQRGNSVCYRCGTTVTSTYVKQEGKAKRMSAQMMATVCVRPKTTGKVYLSPDEHNLPVPDDDAIRQRIEQLTAETGITPPDEEIGGSTRDFFTPLYGLSRFSDLFTARQMFTLLTFVKYVREAHRVMTEDSMDAEYAKAVTTYLGMLNSRLADWNSTECTWTSNGEKISDTFARQALPMVWDFVEIYPLAPVSGNSRDALERMLLAITNQVDSGIPATVFRGSANRLPIKDEHLTLLVTDPPYYDNISYSDLSDYFYVWLSRSIGHLYAADFTNELTPKKNEAVVAPYRYPSDVESRDFYEQTMRQAFREGNRVLKSKGLLVTVYAHKTTAGWSTLVDSLRFAGFQTIEAWPVDTEKRGRSIAQDTAALASSIFLVARKRSAPTGIWGKSTWGGGDVYATTGDYLTDVQPEMQRIVAERVRFFLEVGITGADLNIAAVGAGLAPYTRYDRVELPNGEELGAAAYLDEVQAAVVRVLLGEASKTDNATQYYIMARDYYGEAWVEFDEANNLARATGVELDTGTEALTRGKDALVEKKGSKIRLRDYSERGEESSLGLPTVDRPVAPMIDVLHRLLWLVEHDNSQISDLMAEAMPDKYLLRLTAQALGGRALASEPTPGAVLDVRTPEQRAIDTLLASWRRIVDEGKLV